MKGISILVVAAAMLSLAAISTAHSYQGYGRPPQDTARNDIPPVWSIGTWTGHNDYSRADIDLKISDDGRAILQIRKPTDSRTLRGSFRNGKLDFAGDRYLIRQSGRDLGLTRESNRNDTVILRRQGIRPDVPPGRGGDLSITTPRNNDRLRSGTVVISGDSPFADVQIEVRRGRDIVQSRSTNAQGGSYEFRFNLTPGKYEATVRARDRNRMSVERKVVFSVGGMGKTYIESPEAGAKLNSGVITITGTSEAPDVEVEIYRGRERVFVEQVSVRNNRFTSRPNLSWGTYVVTVRGKEGGEVVGTDKRGFEVVDNRITPGVGNRDLRLDRPNDRGHYRSSSLDFDGTAGGSDVRVQVFRGRDRIANQLVSVRNGRFHARINLDRGHYDATIMSEDHGRVLATRRISFDID